MVVESLFSITQRRTKKVEKVFQYQGQIVRGESYEEVESSRKACLAWLNVRQRNWRRNLLDEESNSLNIIITPEAKALLGGWSPTGKIEELPIASEDCEETEYDEDAE